MSAVQGAAIASTKCVTGARASSSQPLSRQLSTSTLQKTRRWKPRPARTSQASAFTCFHCSLCCCGDNWRGESTNWDWVWDTGVGETLEKKGGERRSWGLVTLPKLNKYKETTERKKNKFTWMDFPFGFWIRTRNGISSIHKCFSSALFPFVSSLYYDTIRAGLLRIF